MWPFGEHAVRFSIEDQVAHFRVAKAFMNETIVDALGIRAFMFTLKLEKCATGADLVLLNLPTPAAVEAPAAAHETAVDTSPAAAAPPAKPAPAHAPAPTSAGVAVRTTSKPVTAPAERPPVSTASAANEQRAPALTLARLHAILQASDEWRRSTRRRTIAGESPHRLERDVAGAIGYVADALADPHHEIAADAGFSHRPSQRHQHRADRRDREQADRGRSRATTHCRTTGRDRAELSGRAEAAAQRLELGGRAAALARDFLIFPGKESL